MFRSLDRTPSDARGQGWGYRLLCGTMRLAMAGLLVATPLLPWQPQAPAAEFEAVSSQQASRSGLETAWTRQMSIAGGVDGFVNAQIVVDPERKRTFVELKADGKVLSRLAADTLNQFGSPIGLEEAQRLAKIEIFKLSRRGIKAEASVLEVPEVRLYTLGRDGTIECRDAETGQLIWVERYGDPHIPALPIAATAKTVAMISGIHLYVIDALTGAVQDDVRLKGVPLQGASIVGDHIFAVCTGGRLEGLSLRDEKAERFTARVAGLPMADPVTSPDLPRMVWSTDAGYLYALDGEGRPGLAFRFPADGLISSSPVAGAGGRFYVATEKGHIYAINGAKSGSVLWRVSLGDPIYRSPYLLGDRLYVDSVYDELYALDASTGQMLWERPVAGVDKLLGGDQHHVLVKLDNAHLALIDAKAGTIAAELPSGNIATAIRNPLTDRTYLVSQSGGIQCLRPVGAELPTLMLTPPEAPKKEAEAEETTPNQTEPTSPFGGDPFGGASDPFGGGADPFGGNGGGDDIFGG